MQLLSYIYAAMRGPKSLKEHMKQQEMNNIKHPIVKDTLDKLDELGVSFSNFSFEDHLKSCQDDNINACYLCYPNTARFGSVRGLVIFKENIVRINFPLTITSKENLAPFLQRILELTYETRLCSVGFMDYAKVYPDKKGAILFINTSFIPHSYKVSPDLYKEEFSQRFEEVVSFYDRVLELFPV